MEFLKALQSIYDNNGAIKRENWPYHLRFNRDGYLTLYDVSGELLPYTISEWDFECDWTLVIKK